MSSAAPPSDMERQALAALRRMRERLDAAEAAEAARHAPLAIVGAACRFPGAPDIDAFWQLLLQGGEGVADIPPTRWDAAALAQAAAAAGATLPTRAGLLPRVDGFDAAFFGITGREAQLMDPQQRLFLEVAWEALERAGIPPLALKGSASGVFVGTTTSDYLALLKQRLQVHEMDAYVVSGNTINATAGRVSYTLGLQGPAMAIDTACSSSLVAFDRACRSVRDGESRLAIAGGVNLVLAPEIMMALGRWGMLAPDGRCKTFDAAADGFVRAEGCGVVLIKRLADALADGDRIWALVRGSAVNQAGASGAFAVPNGLAQAAVMKAAVADARVDAAELGYLESHGTGTPLGDPIEMEGIASVYGPGRDAGRTLWVGAVKSNVGHLEAAAGVTGLIKTVLALRHGRIPPNLHFHTPSPHIAWGAAPLRVPTQVEDFPRHGARRLAAVSAFGFSGTNAHVVLEEAPDAAPAPATAPPPALLLTLSARSEAALAELATRHAQRLDALAPAAAADHCLASAAARSHLPLRLAVSAPDAAELARRLRSGEGVARGRAATDRPGVAFLFSGQGAQMVGMGRRLAEASPLFRDALARVCALLEPHVGQPLAPLMAGVHGAEALNQTGHTQPALFAFQVALVEWWRSMGVEPALVAGHSVGEFAAAWAAGVLSLDDAAALVARRGALMQALPAGGGMAAVMAPEDEVRRRLAAFGAAGTLAVAGVNAPTETVVAGELDALARFRQACSADGLRVEPLAVSHAFHSPLMAAAADGLADAAQRSTRHAPRIAVVSSLSGAAADARWGTPEHWRAQLLAPVRWLDAARTVAAAPGIGIALEIGPQAVLATLGRRALPEAPLAWLASMRRGTDEAVSVMAALGELYVRGAVDDWSGAAGAAARTRADLPTYPFQHQRYWPDASRRAAAAAAAPALHPLLGHRLPLAGESWCFQAEAGTPEQAWLREHRIGASSLWPASASLEMLLAAGNAMPGVVPFELRDVELPAPLRLPDDAPVTVQTLVAPADAQGDRQAAIHHEATAGATWPCVARGRLVSATAMADAPLAVARAACTVAVDVAAFHRRLAEAGAAFGPAFRRLDAVQRGAQEAFADLPAPAGAEVWRLHPAQLDAALQLVSIADADADAPGVWVPVRVDRVQLADGAARTPGPIRAHARIVARRATTCSADVQLWHADGRPLARLEGVQFVRRDAATLAGEDGGLGGMAWAWRWEPFDRTAAPAAARWQVRGEGADALAAALAEAPGGADGPLQWVHLAAAGDAVAACNAAVAALREAEAAGARLWIVTRGAQAVDAAERPDADAAALWGLGRVVRAEHPATRCTLVDVEPGTPPAALAALLRDAAGAARETQLALRGTQGWRLRLAPWAAAAGEPPHCHWPAPASGRLDDLAPVPAPELPPGPGEVSLDVQATGLNFRDVLAALGMVAAAHPVLGGECAGTVRAVGPGVTDLAPGDAVMALAFGSLATRVNVPRRFVAPRPAGLEAAEAAALPIACLTASYGLEELAGLRAGQRVLIHAATGGVGMAALQIARLVGAEIHATAGSEAKRALLRGLGIAHVYDSRSLDFASQVRAATGGRGVDVVLNALAGDFIEAGLGTLAPGGCFLEMGKREVWPAARVAQRFPGLRYHVFDLGDAASADETLAPRLFERLAGRLARGELRPLPVSAWPWAEARAAFHTMAQARHVGKLVLVRDATAPALPVALDPRARYVVTGGLGALGLHVAEALAARGARRLVLLGRRAPGPDAQAALTRLAALGVQVETPAADVADLDTLRTALHADDGAPLRGVVHAAGVLEDAVLARHDAARLARVLAPKLAGARHLAALTEGLALDFFVLFSAGAAWLGAAGQAHYAAANTALEAVAQGLRARGRPATVVAWGRWAGAGMAAGAADWEAQGIGALDPAQACAALFDLIDRRAGTVAVMPLDPARWRTRAFGADAPACFDTLGAPAPAGATAAAATPLAAVRALPLQQRRGALQAALAAAVRSIAGLDASIAIDPQQALRDLGLDSLMTVEVRNALAAWDPTPLSTTLIFDHPTLDALTDHLMGAWPGLRDGNAAAPAVPDPQAAAVAALSDEEAEAALMAELNRGGQA